ncbi:MAG: tetratricopeptide repeat protein [Devosia sp.]|nr:tetratricopeptide repeat protein [Devosia sp.]
MVATDTDGPKGRLLEIRGVLLLAIGLVALLIWGAFFFFSYRRLDSAGAHDRENSLRFKLEAAPWSDRHVESLLAHDPDSRILLRQYVANARERQDWPEALRRADIFIARQPRWPEPRLTRIHVLQRAGRMEEAEADLAKALRRMPREPEILLAWAREAMRRQDWPEASRRFERVRQLAPGHYEGYHENAASALINIGRPDEAEVVIAEGLRRLPENWLMWHVAARIAGRLGKHDEAVRRWEAMRERFPTEPAGFLGGAEALAQVGRGEEAAALILQARDFFPGNKDIAGAAARLAPEPSEPPAL